MDSGGSERRIPEVYGHATDCGCEACSRSRRDRILHRRRDAAVEESLVEGAIDRGEWHQVGRAGDAGRDERIEQAIAAGRAMEAEASASRARQSRQANQPYLTIPFARWSCVFLAGVLTGYAICWSIQVAHKWMAWAEMLHRAPKTWWM
jgi:hypothetical protein